MGELYNTLQNRMRRLESLGLRPDDSPGLPMVLLPIFKTKLPCELKEKWELELTKLKRKTRRSTSRNYVNFWRVMC